MDDHRLVPAEGHRFVRVVLPDGRRRPAGRHRSAQRVVSSHPRPVGRILLAWRHRQAAVADQQRRRPGPAGRFGNRGRPREGDARVGRIRRAAAVLRRAADHRLPDQRPAHRVSVDPSRSARAADDEAESGSARDVVASGRRSVHRSSHREGIRHGGRRGVEVQSRRLPPVPDEHESDGGALDAAAAHGADRRHRHGCRHLVRQPADCARPSDARRVRALHRHAAADVRSGEEAESREREHPAGGCGGRTHLRAARRAHGSHRAAERGHARAVRRRHRIPRRRLQVRRQRRADSAQRVVHRPRRPDDRHRRPQRRRQDDARQPAAAVLRRHVGGDLHRRARHSSGDAAIAARAGRHRHAGHGAVRRVGGEQHRVRHVAGHARRDRSGGARGERARFHRGASAGLSDDDRRARAAAVGRPAPAARDCARAAQERADSGARRGDLRARHRIGAAGPGGAGEPDAEPHVVRHRPPAVDDPPRRRDRRARARPRRRNRPARRAPRASRRHVRDAVSAAAARGTKGRPPRRGR